MTSQTANRRRAIRRFIVAGQVASQQQILELLAQDGHHVTQATVSRDLGAIGAIKVKDADGATQYEIDDHERYASGDAVQRLTQSFTQFVESIDHSDNLVVIHTAPGAAHLVASGIDGAGIDGVLGTVAGDDTILVVAGADVGGQEVQRRFELIGAG